MSATEEYELTFKPTAQNTGSEDYLELTFDSASLMTFDSGAGCTFIQNIESEKSSEF